MADLEALRATIEQKREELQKVKDKRVAAQEDATNSQESELLNRELAAIEAEITRERDLLKVQQNSISAMQAAVIAQENEVAVQNLPDPANVENDTPADLPDEITQPPVVPSIPHVEDGAADAESKGE